MVYAERWIYIKGMWMQTCLRSWATLTLTVTTMSAVCFYDFLLSVHTHSCSAHPNICTTGHDIDQKLKDEYEKLGLHSHAGSSELLHLCTNGPCHCSPACHVLKSIVTELQRVFRGRRDSKALILAVMPWYDRAAQFVKFHGASLSTNQRQDTPDITSDKKQCVFKIFMLEAEKARQGQSHRNFFPFEALLPPRC